MKLSFDDKESFMEAAGCLCFRNPPSNPNREQTGSSSILPQERNEEIYFNNPNALRRMGSSSSSNMPQERSEDT